MKSSKERSIFVTAGLTIGILIFTNALPAWAMSDCSEKAVIPTTLAAGVVRSGEFRVKRTGYWIILQLDSRKYASEELDCALGTHFMSNLPRCPQESPLKGNWTVWDGATQVAAGAFTKTGDGEMLGERILGTFKSNSKKKNYRVEVTFLNDGGRLKAMGPRLIVRQWYDFSCRPM